MRRRERLQATCPIVIDHTLVERAQRRVRPMGRGELLDWTRNCITDLHALVDQYANGDAVVQDATLGDMELAHAMLHACLVELEARKR